MRAVVQRVLSGKVTVDGETTGEIAAGAPGLVILAGVHRDDTEAEAMLMARKISEMRIFADHQGKMNLSLAEVGGASLVISQFTLFADMRRGRRPSFFEAAAPERAQRLLGIFCANLTGPVQQGRFGAHMLVELANDGPVTVILDTDMWTKSDRTLTG